MTAATAPDETTGSGLSALLPGDAEGNVLRDLSLPPTPVLVVSHHGSEDPAIPRYLRASDRWWRWSQAGPATTTATRGRRC